jgi:hypothetical protein
MDGAGVTWNSDAAGEVVVVRAFSRLWIVLVSSVVLPFWVSGGFAALKALAVGSLIIRCAFGLLFLASTALLISNALWVLWGAQVLSVREKDLTVEYRFGSVRIGKPKAFALAELRDLRTDERRHVGRGKEFFRYAISAEYRGKRLDLSSNLRREQVEPLQDGLRSLLRNRV